jgi:crotonobetainyl-CoA hydratase
VATVTIARPDVMNAIDLATEGQLQRIWSELEQRRDVRVIVLTGDGERAFCVGADMKNPSGAPSPKGVDYWAAARPGGFGGIALRETLNIPVIARVNGYALGGGFEMVLGCDIVVACDDASFGLPEPLVGRMPLDGGMTLLQRQIPHRIAMGMLLTGQRINAKRALEIGLVNEVVASGTCLERALELAETIAALPQPAIRTDLEAAERGWGRPLDEGLRIEAECFNRLLSEPEILEGLRRFNERDHPDREAGEAPATPGLRRN